MKMITGILLALAGTALSSSMYNDDINNSKYNDDINNSKYNDDIKPREEDTTGGNRINAKCIRNGRRNR